MIGIVSHDAGGAELLSSYVKEQKNKNAPLLSFVTQRSALFDPRCCSCYKLWSKYRRNDFFRFYCLKNFLKITSLVFLFLCFDAWWQYFNGHEKIIKKL